MVIVMYAPAITDALSKDGTSLEELISLRDHAYSILNQQGDLAGAVERLEKELSLRGRGSKA